MFKNEMQKMSQSAVKKIEMMESSLPTYLLFSALAGIYVAFGICMIVFLGAPLAAANSPFTKLVMSASFGIALTLVIFAGSELFTGNNMFGVIGALSGEVSWGRVLQLWLWCYVGNVLGSLFLAWLATQSGLYSVTPQLEFIQKAAAAKMNAPLWPLFVRGILANWLVCLAVWAAGRTSSDTAKIALIYMCLMAFIAPGFEHSVANMSLLAMGLFQPHPETVTWFGYVRNLIPVTLGNMVGGGLFVGGVYWAVSPVKAPFLGKSAAAVLENAERLAVTQQ
jgi:nitrite transporter